jgi:peptide/nickel transport system substrate-binding protein
MKLNKSSFNKVKTSLCVVLILTSILLTTIMIPIVFAQSTPKYGGTMVWAYGTEPQHVNPSSRYQEAALRLASFLFGKLVTLNHANGDTIIPDLAESWEVSDDASVYTFHLREGVLWHDGTPFTSKDVKWSFEKIVEWKGFQWAIYEGIDTIETPDDHTVIITLDKPNGGFLYMIGSWYSPAILPAHLYDVDVDWNENEWNRKPVGVGPFKFVDWVPGSHITLEANEDYYFGRPYLDKVIMKFVGSAAVALTELEAETADYMEFGFFEEIDRLRENPGLEFGFPKLTPIWIGFNVNETRMGDPNPLNDVRVRKAIAHAIDREDVSTKVFRGVSPAAEGTFLSFYPWCFNEDAKQPEFDIAKANQMLDESGYPKGTDGIRFKTSIIGTAGGSLGGSAEVVKEHLRAVGIEVEIQTVEWGTLVEKANYQHDFDMAIFGGMHGPDPEEWRKFVGTDGFRNCMTYSDEEVDQLFDEGLKVADKDERKKSYFRIQEILAEDLPALNLVEHSYPFLHDSEFRDFFWDEKFQDTIGFLNLRTVWWEGAVEPPTLILGLPVQTFTIVAIVVIAVAIGLVYMSMRGRS